MPLTLTGPLVPPYSIELIANSFIAPRAGQTAQLKKEIK